MTAAAFLKSQNKAALALHEDYVRLGFEAPP